MQLERPGSSPERPRIPYILNSSRHCVMFTGKVAVPFGETAEQRSKMEKEDLKIVNKGLEDEMVSRKELVVNTNTFKVIIYFFLSCIFF